MGTCKHSDPEKKGKKERREMKDRNEEVGIPCKQSIFNTDPSGEINPHKFVLHPLLSAEPDLNPVTNGA